MKMFRIMLLLAAGLFIQGVMAADAPLNLDQIRTQQQQIRSDVMAGTGRYKDMPENTKIDLLAKQDRLLRMIGDKKDPSELTEEERLEAFNTLEWMEATINKTPDERMTCINERRTGSNRVTRICRTQQQIKEDHERARRQMEGSAPIDI
jgi:hypothetical protein